MTGSSLDRLKICCCIAANRWLVLSELRVGTSTEDTAGCWTRTKVCDVKVFGKICAAINPVTAPNSVNTTIRGHLRRTMAITSLALMSCRNIAVHSQSFDGPTQPKKLRKIQGDYFASTRKIP